MALLGLECFDLEKIHADTIWKQGVRPIYSGMKDVYLVMMVNFSRSTKKRFADS